MKFNNFAYIFVGPDLNAEKTKHSIKTNDFTFTTVGIDFKQKELVINIAKELVEDGAQMIELCGGFGPLWIAKLTQALDNKIPVGGVFYGPETRQTLVNLLS